MYKIKLFFDEIIDIADFVLQKEKNKIILMHILFLHVKVQLIKNDIDLMIQ